MKMKLRRIGLSKMATPKFLQLNTEFHNILLANPNIYEKVKKYFDGTFVPAYKIMQEAFKKAEKSDYTVLIKDANTLRGDTYISLYEFVRALIRHPDKKLAAAAIKVKNLLDRYGNFTSTSIDGQTAYIIDLLQEFATNYAEEVVLLMLSPFISAIKENNDAFSALMNERYNETAKQSKVTVVDARKVLQDAFGVLCNLVDSIWVMEESAEISAFITRFNVVLDRFGIGTGSSDADSSTEMPTTPEEEEEIDDTPSLEEQYPDAKEWTTELRVQNVVDNEVLYLVIDGEKVYYRLLDRYYISQGAPNDPKVAAYWEKLG
jgi:hypothetical protein